MNEQSMCNHTLGWHVSEIDDYQPRDWYEENVEMWAEDDDYKSYVIDFVTNGNLNVFCSACGERIDWDAIKVQLGIE
jgi:hypothetical protein